MTTSAHSGPETSILILLRSLFLKSSLSSQGGETVVDVSLLSSWQLSYPCSAWLRVTRRQEKAQNATQQAREAEQRAIEVRQVDQRTDQLEQQMEETVQERVQELRP